MDEEQRAALYNQAAVYLDKVEQEYQPNRQARRAQAKRDRAVRKRDLRGKN